jgi:NADH-quinone oxidoreductase subunit B
LITLQKKVQNEPIKGARWYSKEASQPIPVPVLGPDLMDPRRYAEIRAHTQKLAADAAAAESSVSPTEAK